MNPEIKNEPLVVCKPRFIWRLFTFFAGILQTVVLLYFIAYFILPLQSSVSNKTFAIWIGVVYLYIIVSFICNYPPTLQIYESGVFVTRWNSKKFLSWEDIKFLWERGGFYNKSLTYGSKQFAYFAVFGWLYRFIYFRSIFSIAYVLHKDYNPASKILKDKLHDKYSYRGI